ncbi:GIY-YIG nuclease family protein [Rhodoplanes sp. SY1]|uniref:GIY-YIG nuclease family protein n=1 Tax=Rhodoplanes sp. SY1 TaxID=3166646 RepID=UPI0038B66BA6
MALRFNMLLEDAGIAPSDVRLLRHQTVRVIGRTPYSLWRDDPAAFESYQAIQDGTPRHRARFGGRYWASFVAPSPASSLFVGLYEVRLVGPVVAGTIDPLTRLPVGGNLERYLLFDRYDCVKMTALSDYIGRLSVHWGDTSSARRAWVQRADNQDKEIVELNRVFQEEQFPGFTKLIRPLSEIETMPRTWKEILRASCGVYLLACPATREHYVGSAYGKDGFLGRWQSYAANNHGGNVGLKTRNPSDYFVSVLEVAGSASTVEEILALENTWKAKLHSRDMGLNHN